MAVAPATVVTRPVAQSPASEKARGVAVSPRASGPGRSDAFCRRLRGDARRVRESRCPTYGPAASRGVHRRPTFGHVVSYGAADGCPPRPGAVAASRDCLPCRTSPCPGFQRVAPTGYYYISCARRNSACKGVGLLRCHVPMSQAWGDGLRAGGLLGRSYDAVCGVRSSISAAHLLAHEHLCEPVLPNSAACFLSCFLPCFRVACRIRPAVPVPVTRGARPPYLSPWRTGIVPVPAVVYAILSMMSGIGSCWTEERGRESTGRCSAHSREARHR